MKLISLNVALFEPNNPELIPFLKRESPDIICFQEVTRSLGDKVDKRFISKNSIDGATNNLEFNFFGPTSVFGEINMKDFHGQENFHFDPKGLLELGNYTKSKYKILKAQSIFLEGDFTYDPGQVRWPDEQYRAILMVDLSVNNHILRVINYHGIWTRNKKGNDKTYKACKKILDYAYSFKGNVIICGDFNLFPETPSIKVFEKDFTNLIDRFKVKTTRPSSNELSGNGRNIVDYVFVSPNVKVSNFKVLDEDISDHLPLVLDFDL
jgi:endonuclease/exonuclease/phosphatase family metal-dependent hydrolase